MSLVDKTFTFGNWFSWSKGLTIPVAYQVPNFTNNYSSSARTWLQPITTGDFNNDNRTDIVVSLVDSKSNPFILISDGGGNFSLASNFFGNTERYFIRNGTTADLNSDGWLDFVGFESTHLMKDQRDLILINESGKAFRSVDSPMEETQGHHGGAVGDLNGDGRRDIFGIREFGSKNYNGIDVRAPLVQLPDGTFKINESELPEVLESYALSASAIGDLDGDGQDDLVLALSTMAKDGGGEQLTYELLERTPILAVAFGLKSVPLADWKFNLIGRHWADKATYDAFMSKYGQPSAGSTAGANSIALLDVNFDGKKDIVVGSYLSSGFLQMTGGFQVFLNSGNEFVDKTDSLFPNQLANRDLDVGFNFLYHLADLNGDGNKDFIVTTGNSISWPEQSKYGSYPSIFINHDGQFLPASSDNMRVFDNSVVGAYGIREILPADINGDGAPDFVSLRNQNDFDFGQPGASSRLGYVVVTHLNKAIENDPRTPTTALGTAGNDQLIATDSKPYLRGLAGNDTLTGRTTAVDGAIYYGSHRDFSLRPKADQWTLTDLFGNEGTDALISVGSIHFADKTVYIQSKAHASYAGLPDSLYQFFVVGFGAAPGVTYMDQMAEAYQFWLPEYKENTVKQIVDVFTTKIQFTSVYPQALYREEGGKYFAYSHDENQASKPLTKVAQVSKATFDAQMASLASNLVDTVVRGSASAEAKSSAVAEVQAALGLGGDWTIGKVIYTVFGNLASKPLADPTWGATAKQFANQVAVAKYYTDVLNQSTDDVATLRSVMKAVSSSTDVSTPDSIATLIGVALLGDPGG